MLLNGASDAFVSAYYVHNIVLSKCVILDLTDNNLHKNANFPIHVNYIFLVPGQ